MMRLKRPIALVHGGGPPVVRGPAASGFDVDVTGEATRLPQADDVSAPLALPDTAVVRTDRGS